MRSRIVPVALLCACLTSLAACNDKDTESAPPASKVTTVAPSVAASGKALTDKELCSTVSTAGSDMKNAISAAQKADGHVEAKDAASAFAKFHKTLDENLVFAEDTPVTEAVRAISDEVGKAATATDPISAAADAGFDKLSGNLTTACQAEGFKINF